MDLIDYNTQVERVSRYQELSNAKTQLETAKATIEDNSNTISSIRLEITGKNSVLVKNSEIVENALLEAINQAILNIETEIGTI